MGANFRFRCDQCGYEFIGSGEADRGFFTATNTFECINCEILFDAAVQSCMGDSNEEFTDDEMINEPLTWQPVEVRCPQCSETWPLRIWSAESDGHSPRKVCSGHMQKIELHSMWD
jgi:rubredoxin